MNFLRRAIDSVQRAQGGATLRIAEWRLIESYLTQLASLGIHEPAELTARLERRGQTAETDCVTGEAISFPPEGRRKRDTEVLDGS